MSDPIELLPHEIEELMARLVAEKKLEEEAAKAHKILWARRFSLLSHLYKQRAFSEKTFGPGMRTQGVIDHIRKELKEIEDKPYDLEEWIDVILLAFDGAWRTGASLEDIVDTLENKQSKNEQRKWPDWRTAPLDKAIEHTPIDEKSITPLMNVRLGCPNCGHAGCPWCT